MPYHTFLVLLLRTYLLSRAEVGYLRPVLFHILSTHSSVLLLHKHSMNEGIGDGHTGFSQSYYHWSPYLYPSLCLITVEKPQIWHTNLRRLIISCGDWLDATLWSLMVWFVIVPLRVRKLTILSVIGGVLLGGIFVMLLLPFNLGVLSQPPLMTPHLSLMLGVSAFLFPVFVMWERFQCQTHVVPFRHLLNSTVLGACMSQATLFSSFQWALSSLKMGIWVRSWLQTAVWIRISSHISKWCMILQYQKPDTYTTPTSLVRVSSPYQQECESAAFRNREYRCWLRQFDSHDRTVYKVGYYHGNFRCSSNGPDNSNPTAK